MRFTKMWAWALGRPNRTIRSARNTSGIRFAPRLSQLEDRTVLNGYVAVGAGPGFYPEVAIRVDIQDALGGAGPNNAGSPSAARSDGNPETTDQVIMAYNPGFRGGVNVATGNFDGNSVTPDSLVTAPKAGGGSQIIIWNTQQNADGTITVTGVKQTFYAFNPRFLGGVNITTGDLDGDGKAELICAAGPGGGPEVEIFSPDANGLLHLVDAFYAYAPGFRGGVSVGSNQGYNTDVQVRQVLNAQLPTGFTQTPYPAGQTAPGASGGFPLVSSALPAAVAGGAGNAPVAVGGLDPDTGQVVQAGNAGTLDANNIPLPYVTVGAGDLQYLSGNLLNSYGQVAFRPDISPAGIPDANDGHIVFANWADTTAASNYPTDGSNPPAGVPVGPYVQLGVTATGTAIITRLTAPPSQTSIRNQLITGAGPGGGPHVIVWGFSGKGGTLQQYAAQQFFAFSSTFTGGVNVAIGDVISNPVPTTANGSPATDPLSPDFTQTQVTLSLPETTGNSAVQQVTQTGFPVIPDLNRRYTPQIICTMASGGSLVHIFSDDNPDVTDPTNPFSSPTPSVRTSLTQLNLVPTLIGTQVVADPTNPLGGYTNIDTTTAFNHAIDPQFSGGLNLTTAAFTFAGSANQIAVGSNAFQGGAGFATNPVLAQSVFSVGNGASALSRGSTVSIFNQMSTLTQLSPYYGPESQFSGFNSYTGVGVTVAYGFGSLPNAGVDLVVNPGVAPATDTNPILI